MVGERSLSISIFGTHREIVLEGVGYYLLLYEYDFNGASDLVNLFGLLYDNHVRYDGNPTIAFGTSSTGSVADDCLPGYFIGFLV